MLETRYVTEQGIRFFPITHRSSIVGLSTNTLVLSEAVDVDVNINVDGEPITINPLVKEALANVDTRITNINTGITNINNTLKTKADSDINGVATSASKLHTARNIALAGAVTGTVAFDGTGDVSITTTVNHTHNYAGSTTAGGSADNALKLTTARNIALAGVVTGSVNFDGTGNVSITTAFGNSSNYLPLSGGTVNGSVVVGGNLTCNSRFYQNGYVGSLPYVSGGAPPTSMIWAW